MNNKLLVIGLLLLATAQAQVIKDDFLLNDDTTGTNHHFYCDVGMDSIGNFVAVFTEKRAPGGNYSSTQVYAQMYDNLGNPMGGNFKVSDNWDPDKGMFFPSMGMTPDGRFVVSWGVGNHSFPARIYARIYDSAGNPIGPSFCVSDTQSTRDENDVALDKDGNFVVVWTLAGSNGGDCYARRFDDNGNPLGPPFMVNDIAPTYGPRDPAVAMDQNGNFVVCWEDWRSGNWDIWAQRYDSTGSSIGVNFMINSDSTTANQLGSNVTIEPDGKFAVTWYATTGSPAFPRVYVRLFDADCSPLTATSVVNVLLTENHRKPDIAMNKQGFVVTWHRYGVPGINDVFTQLYDSLGTKIGSNIKVNDSNEYYRVYTRIAKGMTDKFVIAWVDGRGGDKIYKIYGQRYSSAGNPQGSNFRVTEQGTSNQERSSITMDRTGKSVGIWIDYRLGSPDIGGQRIDSLGNLVGPNFRVNEGYWCMDLSVAIGGNDNFVAVWSQDGSGSLANIYGQRFNWFTGMLGTNFLVTTPAPMIAQETPVVAMSKQGSFAIVWWDAREPDPTLVAGIYGQRYDSVGVVIDTIFAVSDTNGYIISKNPSIDMDSIGNFAVVWQDIRNGDWDIYCRRFDSGGIPQGLSFKVNDDVGTQDQIFAWLAMNWLGEFVVTWKDYRNGEWDIYGQRFDSLGNPVGSNFMVNEASAIISADSTHPAPGVSVDDSGRFIICWDDQREGDWNIYAQNYNSDGSPSGTNYRVNNNIEGANPDQWVCTVALNTNQIAFAWTDAKRDKGWDIYAKLMAWPIIGIEESDSRSEGVTQRMNVCPNPARNSMTFSFNLKESAIVKIEIYNVLGQQVKLLTNANFDQGEYNLTWNCRDDQNYKLAQGTYFYQITIDEDSKIGKVVLMR